MTNSINIENQVDIDYFILYRCRLFYQGVKLYVELFYSSWF